MPVRDEARTLDEFLTSLFGEAGFPCEVLIADAGSTDSTREIVRRHQAAGRASVRLLEVGKAFPGRARNVAIQNARGPWIAMTDAGTIVQRGWLRELTAVAGRNPDAQVVFGTYEPILNSLFEKCVALAFVAPCRNVDGERFRGPSTASLLIQKSVWHEVGGFPENLRACEDLLFFEEIAARGYRGVCAPRATVKWHVPGDFRGTFRRFRAYSYHTLRAGLGRRWHYAILKMYVAAAAAILLTWRVHWLFAVIPVVGLTIRTRRSVKARPDIVQATGSVTVRAYALIAMLLLWIDLSAMVGAVNYAISKWFGSRAGGELA